MKILSEHSIDEETAEHFISDTYKKCKGAGVTPSKIVTYIDLNKFSDQVRLSEIEDYINQKTAKKGELDKEVRELKDQISTVKEQKSELEKSRDLVLKQKKKATKEERERCRRYGRLNSS